MSGWLEGHIPGAGAQALLGPCFLWNHILGCPIWKGIILKYLTAMPGTDATSPGSTSSYNPALGRWHFPKGRQPFQYRCQQQGHGLPWHSHGFLAGGEICKLRYGLLSESSRRLYFWRPPRTRSRRTPVGEERDKVSRVVQHHQGY